MILITKQNSLIKDIKKTKIEFKIIHVIT
jgi:hypothetical protein